MFRVASENNIDIYTDTVTVFIRKWIGNVLPTVSIKTYPNQKTWIDVSIRAELKARPTAFNHGKVTGNMVKYKQCNYSHRKAIKQAKHQYRDKVESLLNGPDTYVTGSTDNHALPRENQPLRGYRRLAS